MEGAAATRAGHAPRLGRASIVIALTASYFAYVFQLAHGTWLRAGLGDWIDPYFINTLLEQWHYSVWHLADPASPPMFYPATGTLGSSHGLVLYAPFYVALRPWLHPFAAYTLTLFLVMVSGALSLYAIFRKFLALGFLESLLLTALFCTSANVINGFTGTWSQAASVFLIPPIVLLGLASARCPVGGVQRVGAGLTGLLVALLPAQDSYTGLQALLVSALLLAGARLCLGWPSIGARIRIVRPDGRRALGRWRRMSAWAALVVAALSAVWAWINVSGSRLGSLLDSHHHHWERPAVVALAAGGAALILRSGIRTRVHVAISKIDPAARIFAVGALTGSLVFLWIYLPSFLAHRGFTVEEIAQQLHPRDLSGWRHPMDLARSLVAFDSARSEVVVLAVGLVAWVPWFHVPLRHRLCSLWFLGVSAFVLVLAIRLNGFSLWTTLFASLPGFSSIRDPKRIIYTYELAAALATGLFLGQLPRRSVLRVSIAGLVAALLVTEWNPTTFAYRRPIEVFDRYVESPIAVDRSCRSFFVQGASDVYMSRSDNMWSLYALDAAFIATKHAIPTLNGYSAWLPDNWNLGNPQAEGYAGAVARWVRMHQLRGVCVLDIEARTMTPYEAMPGRE